jgi:NTP pyrophosphatase (non-canonical NTP hydrolase)
MEIYQIKSVIDTFGKQFNIDQCGEECCELVVAINHYLRGRCTKEDVLEEIADVRIMTQVMLEMFDGENGYKVYREIERKKMIRLMLRIDAEEQHKIDNPRTLCNAIKSRALDELCDAKQGHA